MEQLNYFGRYNLSEGTIEKLLELKGNFNRRISPPSSEVFQILLGNRRKTSEEDEDDEETRRSEEEQEFPETQLPATQFAVEEKVHRNVNSNPGPKNVYSISDILTDLIENLETQDGEFSFDLIESLSEEDTIEVLREVRATVTSVGIFNLCSSMIAMNSDRRIKYMTLLCDEILLPKLMELEGASKKLLMILAKCVEMYPDDMQNSIFLKLLAGESKDEKIALSIFHAFDFQRRFSLLPDIVEIVEDLKPWHLVILQDVLIQAVEDENTKNAILKLFLDNASNFRGSNDFGKLVLLFLNESAPFTDTQINLFRQISDSHESRCKILMANNLKRF